MDSSSTAWNRGGLRALSLVRGLDRGSLVLALALPLIFLHRDYNPGFSVAAGSTTLDVTLADLAVLAVALAGLVAGLRRGFSPLLAAPVVTGLAVAFLGWILVSVAYGGARESWYPTTTHLATALKFAEYALLAFAIPLIVRRAGRLVPAAVVLAVWSVVATVVGLIQFAGLIDDLDHTPAGRRKPSFLGYHDFATLSATVLLLAGVVFVCLPGPRRRGRALAVAAVSGAIGMVLGGPLGVMLGSLLALVALLAVGRARWRIEPRRALALVGVWLAVLGGVVLIRSSTIDQGLRLIGVKPKDTASSTEVQSYAHRSLLAYLGVRIWLDHPLLGVGWQASLDPPSYEPYLASAHRRFDQPEESFPSAERRWGVQNVYVQALADMGVPGLLLLVGLFAAAAVTGIRAALRAPRDAAVVGLAGALVVLLVAGVWNDYGLVAAIPLEAATWIGIGLAATAAALARP